MSATNEVQNNDGEQPKKRKKSRRRKIELQNSGPPEILPEEITYFEKIGGGCYGNVFRGECRGKEVAIKKLFRQNLKSETIAEFKKEVEICSRLNSPNVLLFMGACTKPRELAIVTELMPKGNLESLLRDKKASLSVRRRMLYAKDTALGMNWLHRSTPMIIHRDLKPSNLLLDKHGTVKVCDFGLSAIKLTDKLLDKDSIPGTPLWMAPEVLMGRPIDEKCDVYSYGIVLWEIFTREEPFPEFQSFREFKRAITVEHVRPPKPRNCPDSLWRLMEMCWDKEPAERPSFAEILPMLDVVIVDVTIADSVGKKFWKRSFLGKEAVEWKTFATTFAEYLRLPFPRLDSPEWRAMAALLAEEDQDPTLTNPPKVVTMERFGQVLSWFGPLQIEANDAEQSQDTTSSSSSPAPTSFLNHITETLRCPWFHGDVDRFHTERHLQNKSPGTFLVRVSTTVAGAFTISKMSRKGKVNHQRIDFKPGKGFTIKIMTASSGSRLVSENSSLPAFIAKIGPALNLNQPLEPSPYAGIFEEDDSSGNIEGYLLPESESDNSSSDDYF